MARARQMNIVFNAEKCQIKSDEIMFFGNLYDQHGVRPDPAKVQAIHDMARPKNATDTQFLLGLATYLSAYSPKLSKTTTLLRELLLNDTEFQWHPELTKAFEHLKKLICNANRLAYFDPQEATTIQVDASQNALGAALTQGGKVIAFASKSLSDSERRYANIEHEMLACGFGAKRFDTYIFGRKVVIESNH